MNHIDVDGIQFAFNEDWKVTKYDEWRFYRNRFCNVPSGRKAVDLLAISPENELFLIEVKDYRLHPRVKPSQLHEEVSHKVVDTLAGLLPTSLDDIFPEEQEFARAALACDRIRVVLHLEQSAAGSRVAPRKFRLEDVQLKLRQALKPIDVRSIASDIGHMSRLAWSCS